MVKSLAPLKVNKFVKHTESKITIIKKEANKRKGIEYTCANTNSFLQGALATQQDSSSDGV